MENFLRLFIAAVLGGLIGIERQIGGQYAGFRTQLLVCLGSCLFTIASVHVYKAHGAYTDPARIAAQIVVGIGFLGAGAILRHGVSIRGLTTAATLWIVSAIGMAVGFGEYMIAGFTTFLVLVNLALLKNIEDILPKNRYSILIIKIKGAEELKIEEFINGYNIKVLDTKFKFMKEQNIIEQEVSLRYKDYAQLTEFLRVLKNIPDLLEIHIS
ncbi:MAG: MgtC/SapB family protein [Nitrospirae bacterium]|nr:MgtC/SapB family protein [Nitrospirota bacterium]MCL5061672.1 MgtC/SapB family protein [Nitrospirota bacterium]MDA8339355.1 MgtC/SapB family protein [Nitrospiraceae bacterium]